MGTRTEAVVVDHGWPREEGSVRDRAERLPWTGWEVHVIAVGDAVAHRRSPAAPLLLLAEPSSGAGRPSPGRPGSPGWPGDDDCPRIGAHLQPDGEVRVACELAPSVLVASRSGHVRSLPPIPGSGTARDTPGRDSLVIACTPSMLGVIAPGELTSAECWQSARRAPGTLLEGWASTARQAGISAAAAVARRE